MRIAGTHLNERLFRNRVHSKKNGQPDHALATDRRRLDRGAVAHDTDDRDDPRLHEIHVLDRGQRIVRDHTRRELNMLERGLQPVELRAWQPGENLIVKFHPEYRSRALIDQQVSRRAGLASANRRPRPAAPLLSSLPAADVAGYAAVHIWLYHTSPFTRYIDKPYNCLENSRSRAAALSNLRRSGPSLCARPRPRVTAQEVSVHASPRINACESTPLDYRRPTDPPARSPGDGAPSACRAPRSMARASAVDTLRATARTGQPADRTRPTAGAGRIPIARSAPRDGRVSHARDQDTPDRTRVPIQAAAQRQPQS